MTTFWVFVSPSSLLLLPFLLLILLLPLLLLLTPSTEDYNLGWPDTFEGTEFPSVAPCH